MSYQTVWLMSIGLGLIGSGFVLFSISEPLRDIAPTGHFSPPVNDTLQEQPIKASVFSAGNTKLQPQNKALTANAKVPQIKQDTQLLSAHHVARPIALPAGAAIYKCRSDEGAIVFSDQACGAINEVIPRARMKSNAVPAYKAIEEPSQPLTRNNTSEARRPADRHEINRRYDNLIKTLYSIHQLQPFGITSALNVLEQDRLNALRMYTNKTQTHHIQLNFDNMVTTANQQAKGGMLAVKLLDIERSRNQALYGY